ncbi:MAG: hypothetical protein DCC71_15565, partial [Proteobacteria bacterium]
ARWTTAAAQTRDAFLADARGRAGFAHGRFESMLRHGGLHLGGRPHGADDLPGTVAAATRVDAYAFAWEPEAVEIGGERILADGGDWIAADKPAHVTTQASRASRLVSFEAALRRARGDAALVAVHRLDRETSGVVLFAKGATAAARLGRAFAEGRAAKRYLALVSPPPREDAWTVRGWIGRVLDPARYRFALRDAPAPGFRWSESRVRVVARGGDVALAACAPVTGRSHQLRVHLAASGAPIVGDALYGGVPAERVMLHAIELALPDEGVAAEAPLVRDLDPRCAALLVQRRSRSIARSARIDSSE